MPNHVDYYLSLQSPWTYFGHARLAALLADSGATFNVYPVNYGEVFPATGGLPLPKRAPARQAYRMMELERWREHLNIPLNLNPEFYPAADTLAANLVVAARAESQKLALDIVGEILTSVWAREQNIADRSVLELCIGNAGGNASALLDTVDSESYSKAIADDTKNAITKGVFGAPTYVIDDEVFWGQDRLEFVARKLGG